MGGAQSTEQGQYGFHVLKVKENSPAFHAGIEQFFDYIVTINGQPLSNGDNQLLLKTLQEFEGKPLPMGIYSSKDQEFREITLIPSRNWHPTDPTEKSLIAGENVWHVLDVSPNSPAEMAGIIPYSDYIIGSPHMTLRNEDDFYSLVEEYLGKPLRLYLYNSEWDSCRECIIVPNHEWGGNGSLGCDVGYGLLHRIPRRKKVEVEDSNNMEAVTNNLHDDVNSHYGSTNITPQEEPSQREESDQKRSNRSDSVNYSDTIFNAPDYQQPEEEEEHEESKAASAAPPTKTANTTASLAEEMEHMEIKENENDSSDNNKNMKKENEEEESTRPEKDEDDNEERENAKKEPSDSSSRSKDKTGQH
ncbi:GRASP55/65 PDZ-like domain-containing protein [Mycotypha africana]|uniref:GRASP55/65 PDZ-like domain-containing protein n=1 Tax=Mycotypha africana TaxID=64632 RepID=UPI00230008D0|nr:GRASP55/65 PDZ-like domain-containing protein [Mycotypha africana]KAI8971529.1 GRASP55/65 PDZ-like domain-containing protein [Mycotypha africana]